MTSLEQYVRLNLDEQVLIPELTVEGICDAQQKLNAIKFENFNNFMLLIKADSLAEFKAKPVFSNWVDYDKQIDDISGYVGTMLGLRIYSDFDFQEKDKFLTSSMLVKLKTTLTAH